VSAELKVSYAYKKSTTEGSKVERTYSMAVHVRAVQDEMPAGTERLLNILENNIKEVPASASPAPSSLVQPGLMSAPPQLPVPAPPAPPR
jgi:hypothetical protein